MGLKTIGTFFFFKGFGRGTDRPLEMSQSLNRIRSLVSEIEQIQKQGQRVSRATPRFDLSSVPAEEPVPAEPQSLAETAVSQAPAIENVAPVRTEQRPEPVEEAPEEPAQGAAPVERPEPAPESRVTVQWSGNLVLELLLPQNAERIEMKQIGDWIEIRFSDGKAFHIPFKAVA
jgi:hypothetical protein